jgi:hypothetical protein
MSLTNYPAAQCHIPEGWNPQPKHCENIKLAQSCGLLHHIVVFQRNLLINTTAMVCCIGDVRLLLSAWMSHIAVQWGGTNIPD